MSTFRKPAAYNEKTNIIEFIGNPLIAALPKNVSQELMLKDLMTFPPVSSDDRSAAKEVRAELLTRISAIHIPYAHDLFIARSLSRCINWGYAARNPMPVQDVAKIVEKFKGPVSADLERYLFRTSFPIYGFSVLGISGVGKSCSVLNALKRYPQVIDHTEYHKIPFHCAQLVWLKVDSPSDGSAKGLCTAILQQMDAVLGTQYHVGITNRISKDVLTTRVSQCLCEHHLGVLVIDDIQNLCGAKKDLTSDMLSFMVYLMETLEIPVVMIGTPKVLSLFQQEFQLAKRATGDGTVKMELLKENSKEWERFLGNIWNYQFIKKPVSMTPEMSSVFYHESVGNPFLCSLLYKLVQDEAITSGEETFTIKDVKTVADTKLCITSTMRKNMLNGTDEELRRYEYLWKAAEIPIVTNDEGIGTHAPRPNKQASVINYIVEELVNRFPISINLAEKVAKEAVSAKGSSDKEVTLGYAATLYEKVCSSKMHETDNIV